MASFQQLIEAADVPYRCLHWQGIEAYVFQRLPRIPLEELSRDYLSAEEQQRADRYYRSRDQVKFRWRRMLLRTLLAERLSCRPSELTFCTNQWGKPRVGVRAGSPSKPASRLPAVNFNVSHSDEALAIGICAVMPSKQPQPSEAWQIGIDIEREQAMADLAGVARMIMHPPEMEQWLALPQSSRVDWFFELWAEKEAVLKSTGYGLSLEPHTFAVVPHRAPWQVLELSLSGPDQCPWQVESVLCRDFKPFSVALARARPGLIEVSR